MPRTSRENNEILPLSTAAFWWTGRSQMLRFLVGRGDHLDDIISDDSFHIRCPYSSNRCPFRFRQRFSNQLTL
jgi:hypothetical protein